MAVRFTDGSSQTYSFDATGGLYFSDGQLTVKNTAADQATEIAAFNAIARLTFSNPLQASEAIVALAPYVYPNPVESEFIVKGMGDKHALLTLYSVDGRQLRSQECYEGTRVNVGDLPRGLYFVRIGEKVSKLVKSK